MIQTRKGLGQGKGKGYKNMLQVDSLVHARSRLGIKSVQAIPKLNVNRYMGKWYQISALPSWFQQGCDNAIAEYQKKGEYIKVTNSCKDKYKKTKYAYAKAYPVNSGGSKLEVDFVGGRIFTGDYWVLYTDYDVSLVGTPDRKYLWILARNKVIPQYKENKLIQIAKQQGFDTTKLR